MKKKSTDELIIEYMDGRLDAQGQKNLIEALNNEDYAISSLSELDDLTNMLGNIPVRPPSEHMSNQFHSHLQGADKESEKYSLYFYRIVDWIKERELRKMSAQVAFAILLIFAGWMFGQTNGQEIQNLRSEMSEMREMFSLSMLNDSSPSRRIQALDHLTKADQLNYNTRTAIFKVLNRDSNVNVRLTALEILLRYPEDKNVRNELILSIEKQNEPVMQMAMTEAMLTLREKDSVYQLQQMLARKDLNYMVRILIEESLTILS